MTFKNGHTYFGDWKNDKFNGQGTYIFQSQERYEGTLIEGMKEGEGKFFYQTGNIF